MKIKREDLCEFTRARRKIYGRGRISTEDWARYIEAGNRIGDAADLCRDAMKLEQGIGVDVLCDILRMLGIEIEEEGG